MHMSTTVSPEIASNSFHSTTKRGVLNLDKILPKSWYSITDDQVRIVWKFKNCAFCRIIGEEVTRSIVYSLNGTLARFILFNNLLLIMCVLILLGLFKIVPAWTFVLGITVFITWHMTIFDTLVDLTLARKICFSFTNCVQLALSFFLSVSFLFLAQFDYRGIGYCFLFPTVTL